jgi:hypothetical protein
MSNLLVRYIKLALAEAHLARVPQQLLSPTDSDEDKDDEGTEEVNEFSGCGSVAGYVAPLGMDPDKLGRKKNKKRHRR